MSLIGRKPIEIPLGVTVNCESGFLTVEGPKGLLKQPIPKGITVKIGDNQVRVSRLSDEKEKRALHGTVRQVIFNLIKGVTDGWQKKLEVVGIGYRPSLVGQNLILSLGFSHPVEVVPVEGVVFTVMENKITVSGIDKVLVGQMAAKIRAIKPPDAYKGKGIRYEGELIKLKPGKQAKAGAIGVGVTGKPVGK